MRIWTLTATTVAIIGLGACQNLPLTRDQLVTSSSPCADSRLTIYFNEGSNRLTRQASQMIAETGKGLKACNITHARVVGLADATGTPQANLSLSQRRAVAVAEALQRQGVPAPQFEIDAAGEAGATTSGGQEAPVRRRAEVYLSVSPK